MENELNLQGLTNLLLEPYKLVTLEPQKLSEDGKTVILAPKRGDKKLDDEYIDTATLPFINLGEAGIDPEQSQHRVFQEIRELLKDRLFVIEPKFEFWGLFYAMPFIKAALECTVIQLELQKGNYWLRKKETPEQQIDNFLSKYQAELSISIKGGAIPGLNLSSNIRGFTLEVIGFIMPPERVWQEDTLKVAAIGAVFNIIATKTGLKETETDYKKYLEENSHKWWFSWWNRTRQWEEELSQRKDAFAKNHKELKRILLELQCA
ncbi:MAG: hypothetical protein M0P64_00510 [Candidatus Pacebacteria bacterium]|jgi:hypothetical protein|nr:hypothetical protein [Candidatus Paceibacterota bacterium]